ncbi:MAG TPA: outer membrane protein [Pseudolabrys sp.]
MTWTCKFIRAGIVAGVTMLASLSAQAADFGNRYKAPVYSAPMFTWTGFYVGANAGYGFGKSTWDVPPTDTKPKGFLGGGTLGYNYQTGSWVWGLEGDVDYSAMKGSTDCAGGFGTCETKNSWLATARGRIGYGGWNNFLPYLTGGLAMGDIKASQSFLGTSAAKTKLGWTVGLGIEYALWSRWSVKAEYLYVDLGSFDCGLSCSIVSPDNVNFKTNLVRLGVNYRF